MAYDHQIKTIKVGKPAKCFDLACLKLAHPQAAAILNDLFEVN